MPENRDYTAAFISEGGLPPVLFRAFDQEEYALGLAQSGHLRLRPLPYYRQLEDNKRRDPEEGKGKLIAAGRTRNFRTTERRYIYCCSYPPGGDITLLSAKLGTHIVCIKEPLRFALGILVAAAMHPEIRRSVRVHHYAMEYSKGATVLREPDDADIIRRSLAQKSSDFCDECEHRIVLFWPIDQSQPKYIDLQLDSASSFLEYRRRP